MEQVRNLLAAIESPHAERYKWYGVVGVVCIICIWTQIFTKSVWLHPFIVFFSATDAWVGLLAGDKRIMRFLSWSFVSVANAALLLAHVLK